MFEVSIMEMFAFVYKEATSSDIIISSSLIGTFTI